MASTLHIAPGQDDFELLLSGVLDSGTLDQLRARLDEYPAEQPIVVDVAGLVGIDPSGMQLLADVNHAHRAAGSSLRLNRVRDNDRVLSLLEELELTEHFTFD